MKDDTNRLDEYEADERTVEMVCDRLADLGLAIGPDTARELIRAVVTAERPRVEARVREQLETALRTIRVATQSAMGVLAAAATEPEQPPVPERKPAPPRAAAPSRRTPPTGQSRPAESEERRPVFRRPRGR
jgi:hypothetical protein